MPKGNYKRKPLTKEHKERVSRALKGKQNALGVVRSAEMKKRISKTLKGRMPKNIDRIAGWSKGKKMSKEFREKCRKRQIGRKFSEDTKRKMSKSGKGKNTWSEGKQLSEKHKKILSKEWKGNKNPRWKGGVTPENRRIRHSLEYEIWRNEVYKRDNWTCRICGKKCKPKDIVAHHLELFSEYPELRFSVDNGITLCRACHTKIHRPDKLR